VRAIVATLALLAALSLTACDRGDYLGGAERATREAVNGWDMWETEAVQPHETPMPLPVDGTVAVNGAPGFEQAQQQLAAMEPDARRQRAELVYRRFCHHCHGPNGDGRIIVGESFGVRPPDLRAPEIQALSDEYLYDHISDGILPLAPIMTPQDRLLAIDRLRALADAPSEPLFKPRNVEPLR
jgi:mono/diheme cytochrome c family protein